ncbi:hypothetical protein WR25_26170 [Diploscapter pachys]|uniref:Uncharacterized protein n=1 Tax=Diploscapter pachys TaxID=2018661 RepID=A0A2A2J6A0_9BILA|nr:hypothetical protein WR25_26170 [Diploscapter pachys]
MYTGRLKGTTQAEGKTNPRTRHEKIETQVDLCESFPGPKQVVRCQNCPSSLCAHSSSMHRATRTSFETKMEGDVKMRPSVPPPYRNTSIRSSSGSVSTPTVHSHPLDPPYAVTPPTQLNFNPSVNLYRQTSRQSAAVSTPKGHGHYGKR